MGRSPRRCWWWAATLPAARQKKSGDADANAIAPVSPGLVRSRSPGTHGGDGWCWQPPPCRTRGARRVSMPPGEPPAWRVPAAAAALPTTGGLGRGESPSSPFRALACSGAALGRQHPSPALTHDGDGTAVPFRRWGHHRGPFRTMGTAPRSLLDNGDGTMVPMQTMGMAPGSLSDDGDGTGDPFGRWGRHHGPRVAPGLRPAANEPKARNKPRKKSSEKRSICT